MRWGERTAAQIEKYNRMCTDSLRQLDFPVELRNCCDNLCNNSSHKTFIDNLYKNIITALTEASIATHEQGGSRRGGYVTGWNKHVKGAHGEARLRFQIWLLNGKPSSGLIYNAMVESKRVFKQKLKFCKANKEQIQMDILASHHQKKDFRTFWKKTNRLSPSPGLPVSIQGINDPRDIANLFMYHFKLAPPALRSQPVLDVEESQAKPLLKISGKDVETVIKNMRRGKSPGHDDLSIEHLQHAGVHVNRVLAMFFNICIRHGYLPEQLMKTVVIPIVKNKTGDLADKSNYRPISLATVVSKVLDGLLERQLSGRVKLHDAQFGFRPGLSTESAICALKHTVRYYTDRRTPVYAAFLDLSKAFDLVSYDKLWLKLQELKLPSEVINIFRYWYSNQSNVVKWANTYSDEYILKCGVRQGGLSSPALFNIYIDQLIVELSNTTSGCSIDGLMINNISYADDMVLLSPSISALRKLLCICEKYAESHGLQYNVRKSELLVFRAGRRSPTTVPPVTLCGCTMKRVTEFRYLGHLVNEDLHDDADLERERRALSVRCNMVARRFARCNREVKVSLFKAYCQTFYTCSLWVKYTQKAYSALRVQYNNSFRILLRLPRFCSASAMFADSRTDGFHAILRKRAASMMQRIRCSSNSILNTLCNRYDSPIWQHWVALHV